jgi:predicted NACHT family NTPase
MFMKFLFIALCQQPRNQVPLFIELRHLAGFTSKNLIAFMYHTVIAPGAKSTLEQFEKGLASGLFIVILDGFDEIDYADRKDIEKQIVSLRDKFPKTTLIVSSRDDERFVSWGGFSLFHVLPLEKSQLIDLITKSYYDKDIKRKFTKAIKAGTLYEQHKSFLSNPLLAIMMLITFKEISHIPEKLHIFYEQAFDALFFKHDATKEAAFRRKMHSDLPIDEFKSCLAYFSIATYLKEQFSFTDSSIKDELRKALAACKVDTAPEKFLTDLLESVCMVQRDGLHIIFTHRSFQEYFAALFISRSPASVERLLDNICRRRSDIVLSLAYDMNSNLIERKWVLPRLEDMINSIEAIDATDIRSLIMILFGNMVVIRFKGRLFITTEMAVTTHPLRRCDSAMRH